MIFDGEWERGPLRVRMLACDCGEPDCDGETRLLVGTVIGAHDRLWLTLGIGPEEEMPGAVEQLLTNEPPGPGLQRPAQAIEKGMALVGLTWERLTESPAATRQQLGAWARCPDEWQALPAGLLWATRGVTFGPELDRVPAALHAVEGAYVPEGPVRHGR